MPIGPLEHSFNLTWLALPVATLVVAIVSAVFGYLNWRSEGARRRADARRARLEAVIADLAQLFAAIPLDRSNWSEAYKQEFVEKICRVDFKLDKDNPLSGDLVKAIGALMPREFRPKDEGQMATFNQARSIAKDYIDLEWKKFKLETGMKE